MAEQATPTKQTMQMATSSLLNTTDTLLHEERVFLPLPRVVANAIVNPHDIAHATAQAQDNPLAYWEEAAEELEWYRRWDNILDAEHAPFYRWFSGALCNIVHNALDRHIETANRHKLALIWEGETGNVRRFTFFDVYREVNKLASALRALGVRSGDCVVLYMPPIPETVFAMLATAKIGAVHSTVFGGFSSGALCDRIEDAKPKLIITADGFHRNGHIVPLKPIVDEAIARLTSQTQHSIEHVIVVAHAQTQPSMVTPRDIWYHEAIYRQPTEALTEVLPANAPLFMLYTSGTTGKPKAFVHAHGGYMVGIYRTMRWTFDTKPTDIFWSTADPGWITGHSYGIYGALMTGTTTVLYEGHPLYPNAGKLYSLIERWGVSILYTAPTVVRMLMRSEAQLIAQYDITTLRLLSTVGEPISPETWMWLYRTLGRSRCPVIDTWWQTETGMIMLAPFPVSRLKPGSVARPFPGVHIDIVDAQGQSVPPGRGGFLLITQPWPAMACGIFNDPETFKRLYWERFPNAYWTGDVAHRDADGYIWIQGRADDVIVTSGHRIGTAEIEAALISHPLVGECAVIGVPDNVRGEVAKAFIVIRESRYKEQKSTPQAVPTYTPQQHKQPKASCSEYTNDEAKQPREEQELIESLIAHVRKELGAVAVVRDIAFRESLPRNRSGKIMRRLLRCEEEGSDKGDTSTLDYLVD